MTATQTRPIAPSPIGRGVRHNTGFWLIAAVFLTVMAFSTVPTPLYALYQQRDGFATFFTTVIFAAYAVGVMASQYLVGHVSDWLGRRRVLLAAILVELLAAVVFLAWPEVPGLLIARALCGVGIGAVTATATAHLSELHAIARPDAGPHRSGTVSNFANIGGLALGPLVAGVFAQFVVLPLAVPYVVFIVLLALAALAVSLVPETVERGGRRPAYHPQRVALPRQSRPVFFAAGGAAFAAFSVLGLVTALVPSFLAGMFHETSRLLAGFAAFAVFGTAAVAQLLAARLAARTQLILASALMVAGLAALAVGAVTANLAVFLLAGGVAGAGVGILFRSAIGVAASLAPAESRGEVLSAMFLIAYTGLALPVLLVGLALAFLPAVPVLVGFVVAVAALVVVSGIRMIVRR
jgi:MFS family permease